jgi:8-hydroxy-5-deazaflavin:NADPH oxidoreductase
MKVGFIGSGNIGGGMARLFARAGHEVLLSFSRDPAALEALAAEIGPRASVGTPREAARFGPVAVLSVPWSVIDLALEQAGPLTGQIVIDTCNQFGRGANKIPPGMTAAAYNQRRVPGASLVKSFNTLTAGFQQSSAGRTGPDRVVMFLSGDDADAKATVSKLIDDAGFTPMDMGGLADAAAMEAPRRPGAVYGEEYHQKEAREFIEAMAAPR